MNYKKLPIYLGLMSAFFIVGSVSSGAAETTSTEIESITITASRTPLPLEQTGSSVTIISKEELRRRNAISLADILRDVPGFAVNRSGPQGSITQIRIRGSEANHVLVMIDGIEVNDPAQGSEFNFAHLQASDIERVEIVRGPQSALWGSDAVAGVVNVITQQEQIEPSADLAIEAGSFGTQRAQLNLGGGFDRFQIGFSGDYLNSDGTNISSSGGEEDAYSNSTLSLNVLYEATDDIAIGLNLRDTDAENDFDGTDFFSSGLPIDADYRTETDLAYSQFLINANSLEGQLRHRFTANSTDTESRNFTGSALSNDFLAQKKQYSYQLSFSPINTDQTFSLVLERERTDYQQRGQGSFWGDPNQNRSTLTKSVATEYLIHIDALTLSASARIDNNDEFDNATSWRLTAAYNFPNISMKLHASIGESIKNPTFTDRFGYFTNFLGNPDLTPEQSQSWEFGIHQPFLNDRISLSATYFHAKLQDEINGFWYSPSLGTFTSTNIKGSSKRQGTELEIKWKATDNFDSSLTYTYLDSTEETAGKQIDELRRPRHIGALNLNYNWEQKANLNLAVQYNGKQYDNFYPPYPPYQERVQLDAYTLVNLSFSYEISDDISISSRLENLLDKDYEEVYGFQPSGLAAYVGMKIQW